MAACWTAGSSVSRWPATDDHPVRRAAVDAEDVTVETVVAEGGEHLEGWGKGGILLND